MGSTSTKSGQLFEQKFESLLIQYGFNYTKSYEVLTMTGKRKIDFVIHSKFGKVLAECKYRNPGGQIAAKRYAATGLFTTMYEYRQLFPSDLMLAVVNDLSILQPGNQSYVPLLASIGVEVLWFEKTGKPSTFLIRKLKELK